MLRAGVVVVLAANVAFFGWTRGWFEPLWPPPTHGERETGRVAAQVKPEAITLLSARAASAAISGARAASLAAGATLQCLETGPFPRESDLTAAEARLQTAGLAESAWVRRLVEQPAQWAIHLGRFSSTETLRARRNELRRQGILAEELRAPAALAPSLLLARYEDRESATAALPRWAQRGVKGAQVGQLAPATIQWWLRVDRADEATVQQLKTLEAGSAGLDFSACRDRR